MKKALKRIGIGLVGIIIVFSLIVFIFTQTSPQFGGEDSTQDLINYEKSGHYKDGKFQNLIPTNPDDMTITDILSVSKDFIFGVTRTEPEFELPQEKVDSVYLEKSIHEDKLIWFGHSAFLLQLDGQNILLDPMLGETPSPHPFVGPKRFNKKLPIEIEQLPKIDAILISHDHYDHLDYESIQLLKEKTAQFFVPLGVGKHLESWGINSNDIQELNWWDKTKFKSIELDLTPSRHFSGRGFTDRSSSMWGSWVIKGTNKNIYFSGDSGYGPHFKEIGNKYGPFDFAMIECGQYNENWKNIHMVPEETVKASMDLKAKVMMPIHWGAFSLSLHSWDDPIIRVTKEARELNLPITVPMIGEIIDLNKIHLSVREWWNKEIL